MRGRRTPPKNPSIEEMARALKTPGVYILEYQHDDGCPTPRTQRMADCTCSQVDHRLLRYSDKGGRR